jgi:hypothetical protein
MRSVVRYRTYLQLRKTNKFLALLRRMYLCFKSVLQTLPGSVNISKQKADIFLI